MGTMYSFGWWAYYVLGMTGAFYLLWTLTGPIRRRFRK